MKNRLALLVALALPVVVLGGCNLFAVLDSPSGDAQILSAARGAMDRGDFVEARALYAKLGGSLAEIRASEEAFLTLAENGIRMREFMGAFGGGGGGAALTELANVLVSRKGEATRKALFNGYLNVQNISTNPQLKGLVRLTTSLALAAEILAENAQLAGSSALVEKVDLVNNVTTCIAAGVGCAAPPAACDSPSNFMLAGSAINIVTAPVAGQMDGTVPTLGMFKAAIDAINQALSGTELGASGEFSSGTGGLSGSLGGINPLTAPGCFRQGLLSQSVGN